MELPLGVLGVFAALVVWAGLLVRGFRSGRYSAFLFFGLLLMLFLNIRYLIEGSANGIAFFIGIYDVLINVGGRGRGSGGDDDLRGQCLHRLG